MATSSGDSTFGMTTTSGRASATAARSSRHHGDATPLIRTATVARAPARTASTSSARVASVFSSGATPSSRSSTISSAGSIAALASILGLDAGTVRHERRGLVAMPGT